MQDFEKPRWEAAVKAFAEAFSKGYTQAKAELASGMTQQTGDAPGSWPIDVPRREVVDGVALGYAPVFEEAGRTAALAKHARTRCRSSP
jgi:hypothetical protein